MIELEKPLSEEEQVELLKNKDDPKVKEKLIIHNLKLALWIAKKYQRGDNPNRELDDLFQEGVIGLIKAIDDYDSDKCSFSTYAVLHIKGSILRAITNKGRTIRLPSHMIEQVKQLKTISDELGLELGREPTPKEIGKRMDIDINKVIEIIKIIDDPISVHTIVGGDDEDITLMDTIPDDGPTTEEIAESNVFIEQFKAEFKEKLEELQYESIRLFYGLDCPEYTMKEIANKYKCSLQHVRTQRTNALREIRKSKFIKGILDDRTSFVRSIDYSQPKVKGGQYVSPVERIVVEREKIENRLSANLEKLNKNRRL